MDSQYLQYLGQFLQSFLRRHEYLSPFHCCLILIYLLTIIGMNKFLLSFRLYEPVTTTLLAQTRQLSRQDKYDKLIQYLKSISRNRQILEDSTTSFILFQTFYDNLNIVSSGIIENCGLTQKDELFIMEFYQGKVLRDCRIKSNKVCDTNQFTNWIS